MVMEAMYGGYGSRDGFKTIDKDIQDLCMECMTVCVPMVTGLRGKA